MSRLVVGALVCFGVLGVAPGCLGSSSSDDATLTSVSTPIPPDVSMGGVGVAFRPLVGWREGHTDAAQASQDWTATAWASTVPYVNSGAVFPSRTISRLPRNGALLWVFITGHGHIPKAKPVEPIRPYQLADARVDHGWEGQPAPNIEQRVIFARLGNRYTLAIYAFFGTQTPSRATLRRTQEMLDRLMLPA